MAYPAPPQKKRTVWTVLTIIGVVLLICCGVGANFGVGLYKSAAKINDEADTFASTTLVAIAEPWDAKAIESRADQALIEKAGKDGLEKMAETYAQDLGALKTAGPFTAKKTNYSNNNGVEIVEVTTTSKAEFEKGPGSVTLDLVRRDGQWKIVGIWVDSTLLPAK